MRLIVKLRQCLALLVLVGVSVAMSGCGEEATKPSAPPAGSSGPPGGMLPPPSQSGKVEQAGSAEDSGAEVAIPDEAEEGASK